MVSSSMSGLPTLSPLFIVGCSRRPLIKLLMLVRTNAEPFPGLTCWNSMISKGSPSISILRPLRNSEVSMTPAIAAEGSSLARSRWEERSELVANLRRRNTQRVAAFPVVAFGPQGQDNKIVRGDEPHHRDEFLGIDADLGHSTGLEQRGSVLKLRQNGGVLHPGGPQVEVEGGLVLKRLHRNPVEAHHAACQR